jgi:hypothetical protein
MSSGIGDHWPKNCNLSVQRTLVRKITEEVMNPEKNEVVVEKKQKKANLPSLASVFNPEEFFGSDPTVDQSQAIACCFSD